MIIKLQPSYRPMVWGSENWVVSGYPERQTLVAEGPLAGKTLNEVYGEQFPLLIKFIDAREDLSIQVHPDDALAAARGIGLGKTEMWYVMRDGGSLISGLTESIDEKRFLQLVSEDRLTTVLAKHDVGRGDVFFLPPGRVHAICGGTFLCEIQETSDNTYRLFDYNRPGLDGKPRQLHVREARAAIDYKAYPSYRTDYDLAPDSSTVLVRDPHFTASVFDLRTPCMVSACVTGRFLAVMCVEGSGYVDGTPIREGEALLVLDEKNPVEFAPEEGCVARFLTAYE